MSEGFGRWGGGGGGWHGGHGGFRGGRGFRGGHGWRRGGWWGPWYDAYAWEPVQLTVDKCAPDFKPEQIPSFINGRPVVVQWVCGNRVLNGTDGFGALSMPSPYVLGGAAGGALAGLLVGGSFTGALLGAALGAGGGYAATKLAG
jgi:hypothetical protein